MSPSSATPHRSEHEHAEASRLSPSPVPRSRLSPHVRKSASSPRDLVGCLIDRQYAITGVLGEGGMGAVLAGHHIETGCAVALKFLSVSANSPANLYRFRREAM